MCTNTAVVRFAEGLHLKSASDFSQLASKFISDISIAVGSNSVNAKSLLGILSLGIVQGTNVTVTAFGSDEASAVTALINSLS